MPWWAYDSEANTLYLGSVNGKQTVTCDAYNHPWKGIIDTTKIETVITCGQLAPTSMVGWFGSGDAYAYDLVDGGRYRIKAQNHSSGTYIPNWGAGLTTNGNSPYVFMGYRTRWAEQPGQVLSSAQCRYWRLPRLLRKHVLHP